MKSDFEREISTLMLNLQQPLRRGIKGDVINHIQKRNYAYHNPPFLISEQGLTIFDLRAMYEEMICKFLKY
jgi:hypothetical protein